MPGLRPHDPGWYPTRFRLVPVRSPLLRESRLISVPPGTEMFQFPGSPTGIPGSTLLGQLPRTYRSQHARHLMTPRHPPRALMDLTTPTGSRPDLPRETDRCRDPACRESHPIGGMSARLATLRPPE